MQSECLLCQDKTQLHCNWSRGNHVCGGILLALAECWAPTQEAAPALAQCCGQHLHTSLEAWDQLFPSTGGQMLFRVINGGASCCIVSGDAT